MPRLISTPNATSSVLAILALAGCGQSQNNQSQPAPPSARESAPAESSLAQTGQSLDLCALITDEEFQKSTGFPVLKKESFPGNPSGAGCNWQLKTSPAAVHSISVDIKTPGGRERFNFMASGSLKKVPDLGDGAVQTGGNIDGTVWTLTGDTLVTLRYSLPVSTTDPNPVVFPLIKALLPKL